MTFPTPNGSTNLGDPITDTGERRRREERVSELKRYKVVEVDYEGFHFEMDDRWPVACEPQHGDYVYSASQIDPLLKTHSRLREKVKAYRDAESQPASVSSVIKSSLARMDLFAELDAQEKGNG